MNTDIITHLVILRREVVFSSEEYLCCIVWCNVAALVKVEMKLKKSPQLHRLTHVNEPVDGTQQDGPGVGTAHVQHVVLADGEGVAQHLECGRHLLHKIQTIKGKTWVDHVQQELWVLCIVNSVLEVLPVRHPNRLWF